MDPLLRFIGLPYADKGRGPVAYDCWGLCAAVYRDVYGLPLPDYADSYTSADDGDSVAAAVRAGLADWKPVQKPRAGDLLILRILGRPWHCAVMVDSVRFLHVPPPGRDGRQTLSCVERIDAAIWARRIEGFYRHD